MKTNIKFLCAASMVALLTSCASTSFYQVYQTTPSKELKEKDNYLAYEDDNCRVFYDLWYEGGYIGFNFYNKTDDNIYLDLGESFFILNGMAFDYFKNRTFTKSKSSGVTKSEAVSASEAEVLSKAVVSTLFLWNSQETNRVQKKKELNIEASSGHSVSYNEEKIICIPSRTSKIISEYKINTSLYRDCDLLKYPSKKQIKSSESFTKEDSPFIFSNRIAYRVRESDNLIRFENEFYVSEITNCRESEVLESDYDEFCGQKSNDVVKYFRNSSPDKFYIQYSRGDDIFKH
jgi:hypothetical protein